MKDMRLTEADAALINVEQSEMDGKYLTFFTDHQLFGVPIADVVQIVQVQPITVIPEYPAYAKGIINLRGTVIPVIDMRLRLGKQEVAYDDHTCIIVTNIQDTSYGFIVDSVDEVADIPDEEISPPPQLAVQNVKSVYLTGIGKHEGKVILLIDTKKVLSQDEYECLQQV